MEFIERNYMGSADNLLKIYVPLKLNKHRYLMIVDMWGKKLVYLDSAKCSVVLQTRLNHMQDVAKYLDDLLAAGKFYNDKSSIRRTISDFEFLEPTIGQQRPIS
ncbi:hypothetical protein PIB30_073682 [Stylosanthes scabra]|uniref:Ubiquitin-like protease family profile domain-containing protein n=1 Tax=Stylosanthes scabra TaxID=79078 RepID=A0ABU6SQF0_9FABA|nr:hypothetical protein [Stylosanthes scabra]